jgi:hypothetical protein
VTVTYKTTIEEFCKEMAGNHFKIADFCWDRRSDLDDPQNWCLYHYVHRDSGLVDQSNGHVIETKMRPFVARGTAHLEHFSHWAVGWIDAVAIKVYSKDGTPTKAVTVLFDLLQKLDDYPLLDETEYCNREYDATLQNIRTQAIGLIMPNPPAGWESDVYRWLGDNDGSALENIDDRGPCPDDDQVKAALKALNLFRKEKT